MDALTNGDRIAVVGTLAGDPEIRYDRAGIAHGRFDLTEGDYSTAVHTSADLAENVALSLTRGMAVVVIGREDDGIIAEHVGPSLAGATVDVFRISRRTLAD